jgi:hypothetical protein
MAIKLDTVEVLSNGYALSNIVNATGVYSDLFPDGQAIGTTIDMDVPLQTKVLSAATTFTFSNINTGKQCILLLDLSSNGYAPTFPAGTGWPEETEPSWTGTRYWQVCFTAWDNTTVRAIATGYSGAGTNAANVDLGANFTSYVSASGQFAEARVNFNINNDGSMNTNSSGSVGSGGSSGLINRLWLASGSASDYDIKWDGTGATSKLTTNPGLGTWLNLGTTRTWVMRDTDVGEGNVHSVSGTLSIRDASTQSVIDTCTATLSVDALF